MARGGVEEADGGQAGAGGVRLGGGDEVAEGRLGALAQRVEQIEVGLGGAVPPRAALVRADVVDDGGDRVHDGLHGREDARRGVGPPGGEEVVDRGQKGGDVDVGDAAVLRHGQLLVELGRLQEYLRGGCVGRGQPMLVHEDERRKRTFEAPELGLGLLVLALVVLELDVHVADDDEVRVFRGHQLVVAPREVGDLREEALHVGAQLVHDLGIGAADAARALVLEPFAALAQDLQLVLVLARAARLAFPRALVVLPRVGELLLHREHRGALLLCALHEGGLNRQQDTHDGRLTRLSSSSSASSC